MPSRALRHLASLLQVSSSFTDPSATAATAPSRLTFPPLQEQRRRRSDLRVSFEVRPGTLSGNIDQARQRTGRLIMGQVIPGYGGR